ncbi:hypothetical protein LBMAG21_14140 [Armatimonadota bacterium]|nr:hypothetical protein LBMAG21_14140 [Armatimonadota bacterium]
MLTAEGCLKRRERLWQSLDLKPDWIVLSEPQHLIYFANFAPSPFTYATQNASAVLLLGADGSSILVADNLQGEFAKKAHVDRVESFEWYNGRGTAPYRTALLTETVVNILKTCEGSRFGYEPATHSGILEGIRGQRQKVETFDVSSVIHTLKRSKDPDEVAILRRCMRSAEAGFSSAIRNIKPGMTELQAYELVASAVMEEAQDRVIVYGDFATGPHAFGGGGGPTLRVIEKNDFILLDFSVIIHGYRGDFANTFVVDGGKANSRQHEMARVCLEGMATGEKLLQAGTACNELDVAIRNVYKQHGAWEYFQHHAGHGLGLGHPDAPYIVPESTDSLVEGDVITLEPGMYIPNVGGMRFERNYLITKDGFECLTNHFLGLEPPR